MAFVYGFFHSFPSQSQGTNSCRAASLHSNPRHFNSASCQINSGRFTSLLTSQPSLWILPLLPKPVPGNYFLPCHDASIQIHATSIRLRVKSIQVASLQFRRVSLSLWIVLILSQPVPGNLFLPYRVTSIQIRVP